MDSDQCISLRAALVAMNTTRFVLHDGGHQLARHRLNGAAPPPPSMAGGSKICGVCGDAARCHHFGGLCCASCKAFFRRSVVKDQYKEYRCIYGGSCVIDVTTRKHCSHCRLKNCLAIGMDKKWFMSEEMRAELKRKSLMKMAKCQSNPPAEQLMTILPRHFRPEQDRTVYLSDAALHEIKSLVSFCSQAYIEHAISDDLSRTRCHHSSANVAIIFGTCIRRTMAFIQYIPQVRALHLSTQAALMKTRIMEVLVVLSSLTFDPTARAWISTGNSLMKEPKTMHVCAEDFVGLHGEGVMHKHFDVLCSLLSMRADREIIVLLSLISYFSQEHETVAESSSISTNQEHFIHLLKMYLRWKFGSSDCESVFARFILKLSDAREANELHQNSELRLSSQQIQEVEQKMGGLRLLDNVGGKQPHSPTRPSSSSSTSSSSSVECIQSFRDPFTSQMYSIPVTSVD